MTRDELHDRFIREGAFPSTPKGRGLINDLVIDAEVCEQATCEGCGPKGLEWICSHDTGHMWEASSPHLSQRLYVKENQS
jgi:hypothetical protein